MDQPQQGFAPRRQYDGGVPIAGRTEGSMNGVAGPVSNAIGSGAVPINAAGAIPANVTPPVANQPKVKILQRSARGKKEKVTSDVAGQMNKLSIEESFKLTEASGFAMKTPVSVLQELLSRRGITPNYELVQIEGAIHEPTFRYRVSFNDKEVPFTAMGAGRSKKEAKHSAARALIDKLTGVQMPETPLKDTASAGATSGEGGDNPHVSTLGNNLESADKVVGNPIGWLQEMCMSRRWPPPTYETETEVGLPHERLFTIACTILNYKEVGKGKSKKVAKRLAAHKMWTRLQEEPLDNNQIMDSLRSDLEGDNRNCTNYYGDLKDMTIPTLTSQHSNKVSQFHKTLKSSTGKKLLKLQKTCLKDPKIDFVKLLSEIALENQFEVTYVDIEEKSFSDQFQCLVQLSTLPVGVCHGAGPTAADAKREAAQNALEYLKIMTKK